MPASDLDPSRLLILWVKSRGGDYRLSSYPTLLDWQAAPPRSLAGLGFVRGKLDVLSTPEGPLRATTGFVSAGYLKTLGATPLVGRFFTSDEAIRVAAAWMPARRAAGVDPVTALRSE